ncbi:hypothetical protein AC578_6550 [Pseudocercospora eumusae]|uniref:Uncharacterized protein n=1 Tax=Pseudocercospora eumusae TaxID=321146 RepID=A0A139HHS0_9PEZI|nr:hypothetical protein AC578_6550 [Pseudocercospora eumusae]
MAAPHNGPATEAADSSRENANTSTGAPNKPKVSAGNSKLKNVPKATAKDTVLARPNFKTKGPKLAAKKTGGTAPKKASPLSRAIVYAEDETNDDAVEEPLDSPALRPNPTKARKSAPVVFKFTGSMLPRIAAANTARLKAQDPDMNKLDETRKGKRGEGKTQPAKKKGATVATEDHKLWKPADPFNIQYPRCAGCQAVFCTCGYKPEYCSCTCWSCGRKAGGK